MDLFASGSYRFTVFHTITGSKQLIIIPNSCPLTFSCPSCPRGSAAALRAFFLCAVVSATQAAPVPSQPSDTISAPGAR